eukprot:2290538-Prymnesium_polylepis.1
MLAGVTISVHPAAGGGLATSLSNSPSGRGRLMRILKPLLCEPVAALETAVPTRGAGGASPNVTRGRGRAAAAV